MEASTALPDICNTGLVHSFHFLSAVQGIVYWALEAWESKLIRTRTLVLCVPRTERLTSISPQLGSNGTYLFHVLELVCFVQKTTGTYKEWSICNARKKMVSCGPFYFKICVMCVFSIINSKVNRMHRHPPHPPYPPHPPLSLSCWGAEACVSYRKKRDGWRETPVGSVISGEKLLWEA